MVYLFLISVLLVLWGIDGYLTIRVFRKYGSEAEENPILRQLLRHNIKYFLLFKLFDAMMFTAVIFLIFTKNELIAAMLLGIFIILYSYVNWRNYQVLRGKK